MTDYKKLADDTEKAWGALADRQDADRDLVNLERYTLRDSEGKVIPHALSIALNDVAVFATNVEAALAATKEQVMVTSEDKGLNTLEIETFIKSSFKKADDLLADQGRFPFNPFVDQQNCKRGRSAARVRFEIDPKTGELTPEIIPCDTYAGYFTYGRDSKGLAWTSYKTWRSKDQVLADYPDLNESKLESKTDDIEVQDIWSRVHNEVWVNGFREYEEKNYYGYVPAVIRVVPMGSMLLDKGYIKYEGESIFFMMRDLMPALNEFASTIKTLNQKAIDHALQLMVPDEDLGRKPPEHDEVTKSTAVTMVAKGGGFAEIPLGELRQQAWLYHGMIEARMQRAGVNSFDLGTFTQQMSAVALLQVAEGRDQVFLPRLATRGSLKDGIAKMAIDQVITSGVSEFRLDRQMYKVSDFEGEYDITHRYTDKSPAKDMARWAMYKAAEGGVSKKTRRATILELEDPEGEDRELRSEEAELIFPTIKQYRAIKALAELADKGDEHAKREAFMAAQSLGLTLKQALAGEIPQPQQLPEGRESPEEMPLMPVLDAMGRVGKSPVQEELIGGNGGKNA